MTAANETILRMHQEGATTRQIADALGLSINAVQKRLLRHDQHGRGPVSVIDETKFRDAAAGGARAADLAALFGTSLANARFFARSRGIKLVDGRLAPRRVYTNVPHNIGGYIKVYRPDHPNADKRGRVFEHRLIMEEHIGRFLDPVEVVHHMNHVRHDNRIDNLMLLPDNRAHLRLHHPKGQKVA